MNFKKTLQIFTKTYKTYIYLQKLYKIDLLIEITLLSKKK